MTVSKKTRKYLLGVRPLDISPFEQLGDDSLYVVCAALCHWYVQLSATGMCSSLALVFAIKHLYNIF